MAHSAVLRLSRTPTAAGEARRWARAFIAECGADHEDELTLVLSELVSNALTHGAGDITVVGDCDESVVTFSVSDSGSGDPAVQDAAHDAESGRGMRLVDELSGAWGWVPAEDGAGKTVWFRIP